MHASEQLVAHLPVVHNCFVERASGRRYGRGADLGDNPHEKMPQTNNGIAHFKLP